MNEIDHLTNALTTILVTIDPPGLAPIFLTLTNGLSRADRRHIARQGALIAFGILATFAIFGNGILGALGISIGAFRIAGGLLLFWIAFEMIFEKRNERKEKTGETATTRDHIQNIAVFPLALPLIAGPGAISATVLLSGTFATTWQRIELLLARSSLPNGSTGSLAQPAALSSPDFSVCFWQPLPCNSWSMVSALCS